MSKLNRAVVKQSQVKVMEIFENLESEVQSYARSFPVVFNRAKGSYLFTEAGERYIDFLGGAGTLNYGHNNPVLKQALIDYIVDDGITHGLDMHTRAKAGFLQSMQDVILAPRELDYIFQFTGPTGTNAVEAALKVARKVTGRSNVLSFTNGFHGCTLGAVAATGNKHHRGGAAVSLTDVQRVPFCGYHGRNVDTLKMIEKLIADPSSGVDLPAAMLVETVQGEGGLNVADSKWLQGLERICRKHEILLIVDDIQAGCGRTGTFFSFEEAGIKPDLVTLSKSLSGFGLPFAVVLIKPELDVWEPGEHNGTFRGNNHAFVTAKAAVEHYWSSDEFAKEVVEKGEYIGARFKSMAEAAGFTVAHPKGRGMMRGLAFANPSHAACITKLAFDKGLVVETAGSRDEVVKCLAPLTTPLEVLAEGLDIIEECMHEVLKSTPLAAAS